MLPVPGIERPDSPSDRAIDPSPPIGGSIDSRIMKCNKDAVCRPAHVDLHEIDAEFDPSDEQRLMYFPAHVRLRRDVRFSTLEA